MNCAAIDIGTNTILLAIAKEENGIFKEILDLSTIVRLGEGLANTGSLKDVAQSRTMEAIRDYLSIADSHGVDRLFCVGTAALREADNSRQFLSRVRDVFGLEIEIISARDEAFYTYLSVKEDAKIYAENMAIIDIGGGSTEIICGTRHEFVNYVSFPMGSVRLTDVFVSHDPPQTREIAAAVGYIREHLAKSVYSGSDSLIGTGGTVTNIASLILRLHDYDKSIIHGFSILLTDLEKLIADLSSVERTVRMKMIGMEKGREDIIIQGALILKEIMTAGSFSSCTVSAAGLRFGLIYEKCRDFHENPA